MDISKESDLDDLFKLWENETVFIKKRNLKTAIDTVDLNIMYYEEKANVKGLARMENCLKLLENYRQTLVDQQ